MVIAETFLPGWTHAEPFVILLSEEGSKMLDMSRVSNFLILILPRIWFLAWIYPGHISGAVRPIGQGKFSNSKHIPIYAGHVWGIWLMFQYLDHHCFIPLIYRGAKFFRIPILLGVPTFLLSIVGNLIWRTTLSQSKWEERSGVTNTLKSFLSITVISLTCNKIKFFCWT